MLLGIDPKVDYAFKHLFGRDATRPLLMDVINSILEAESDHRICEIELLNPFNPKETLDDKLSVLDIKARDQAGRQFNVEMQMLAFPHFEKRIFYYGAKLHQQQFQEGDEYAELMPTISISFLDHVLFPHAEGYHLQFRLLEKSLHFVLTDDIVFHILELPKFIKKDNDLSSGLDKWLYFLRHAAMMEVGSLPAMMQQSLFLRAIEELKMLNQTDLERERYESRRKAILDENTRMRSARREGLKEGREEGIKEGIKEGFAKGRQIGVIHVCERLLHRTETPAEQLAQLSLEELNRLADELQASILPK